MLCLAQDIKDRLCSPRTDLYSECELLKDVAERCKSHQSMYSGLVLGDLEHEAKKLHLRCCRMVSSCMLGLLHVPLHEL